MCNAPEIPIAQPQQDLRVVFSGINYNEQIIVGKFGTKIDTK